MQGLAQTLTIRGGESVGDPMLELRFGVLFSSHAMFGSWIIDCKEDVPVLPRIPRARR